MMPIARQSHRVNSAPLVFIGRLWGAVKRGAFGATRSGRCGRASTNRGHQIWRRLLTTPLATRGSALSDQGPPGTMPAARRCRRHRRSGTAQLATSAICVRGDPVDSRPAPWCRARRRCWSCPRAPRPSTAQPHSSSWSSATSCGQAATSGRMDRGNARDAYKQTYDAIDASVAAPHLSDGQCA